MPCCLNMQLKLIFHFMPVVFKGSMRIKFLNQHVCVISGIRRGQNWPIIGIKGFCRSPWYYVLHIWEMDCRGGAPHLFSAPSTSHTNATHLLSKWCLVSSCEVVDRHGTPISALYISEMDFIVPGMDSSLKTVIFGAELISAE